jgi:hypothetical protein
VFAIGSEEGDRLLGALLTKTKEPPSDCRAAPIVTEQLLEEEQSLRTREISCSQSVQVHPT